MKRCASWVCVLLLAVGCTTLDGFRSQSPEELDEAPVVQMVGDVTIPFGRPEIVVEGVALVTGLRGQGSDPPNSQHRGMLLDERRRHNVQDPERLLASKDTSLVLVRGTIRMGMKKGDRFDIELRVPGRDETRSLREAG